MNPRGFGFVDFDAPVPTASSLVESAFVPPKLLADLLSDDTVALEFSVEEDGRGTVATLEFLDRSRTELFGVVVGSERAPRLRPDPHVAVGEWKLAPGQRPVLGSAVRCSLSGAGLEVLEAFPDAESPAALRSRVLARRQVPVGLLEGLGDATALVLAGAGKRPRSGSSRAARLDLRHLTTFTIDADHSMDLDDALSVLPADDEGAVRVFVHIADVAEHVRPGDLLDAAAAAAGTSVYLPHFTLPMLPRELSEASLSLVPGAERDVLTVELRINPEGFVVSSDIFESRIVSRQRLSYDTAALVLEGSEPDGVDGDVLFSMAWLRTAAARLSLQRARRGGVEARRVEPELYVHVEGDTLTQAPASQSNPAHLLIERLMVAANEAVAAWLVVRGLPGLFRVHDEPGPEAAAELEVFAANLGFHPGFGGRLTPLSLAALEAQLSGTAPGRAAAVWDVVLSHLGRAEYSTRVGPHFGLGSAGYLHFTSPLRRYADLTVHRVVKSYLAGGRTSDGFPAPCDLSLLAAHVNVRAASAKRAETEMRKVLWLKSLQEESTSDPGRRYTGRVTGMSARGAFVSLDSSHVSGFLPWKDLPGGPWRLEEPPHRARGGGSTLELGQRIEVGLARLDVESGTLELVAAAAPKRSR